MIDILQDIYDMDVQEIVNEHAERAERGRTTPPALRRDGERRRAEVVAPYKARDVGAGDFTIASTTVCGRDGGRLPQTAAPTAPSGREPAPAGETGNAERRAEVDAPYKAETRRCRKAYAAVALGAAVTSGIVLTLTAMQFGMRDVAGGLLGCAALLLLGTAAWMFGREAIRYTDEQ